MTYLALAENEIITAEGLQLSFDQMVDHVRCQQTILRFSHGNFACSVIQDIEPDLNCESVPVTLITLSTGEQFLSMDKSEVLTTENKWMTVSNVQVGDGLKTLTYNPSVRHPQLTPKIIVRMESYVAPFLPVVSFETRSDNLLLSVAKENGIFTLIPLRPTKEFASMSVAC